MTVHKRTLSRQNCPYCARKRGVAGVNDLATVRPDLAAEWDASNHLRPDQVLPKSGARRPAMREGTYLGNDASQAVERRGCPYCAGHRVIPGETDLATLRPELVNEWSPDNVPLPTEVKPYTLQKVKWVCSQGHTWEATVSSRSREFGVPLPLAQQAGSTVPLRKLTAAPPLSPGRGTLSTALELRSSLDLVALAARMRGVVKRGKIDTELRRQLCERPAFAGGCPLTNERGDFVILPTQVGEPCIDEGENGMGAYRTRPRRRGTDARLTVRPVVSVTVKQGDAAVDRAMRGVPVGVLSITGVRVVRGQHANPVPCSPR